MMLKNTRLVVKAVCCLVLVLLAAAPLSVRAQESVYFAETGHAVSGRLLEYWQQNGGLPVFGYPLTDQLEEEGRTVQYFERARFELHPENAPPYDVLLGRLGVTVLEQRGINWQTQPQSPGPAAGCLWFEATRHNVCNQLATQDIGFLNYWRTHGLEFDGQPGSSYGESLALFGAPVTEPYILNLGGQEIQVQWFERARFEWHPNNPAPYRVLLGRLGAQVVDVSQSPLVSEVQLYFIALEDRGSSGIPIGCNDSAVPVQVSIEPTQAPLTAALQRLFSIDGEYYGQSGLYNALHQSTLSLESAAVEDGQATIYLTGNLLLGGVCDSPRIEAQIKQTARQFVTVNEVLVYLNGQRLEDALSGQGM